MTLEDLKLLELLHERAVLQHPQTTTRTIAANAHCNNKLVWIMLKTMISSSLTARSSIVARKFSVKNIFLLLDIKIIALPEFSALCSLEMNIHYSHSEYDENCYARMESCFQYPFSLNISVGII